MSFQQGLSGLNAASRNLDVIGHNVANANTVGHKGSRAEFADMYANALNGTGNNRIGIGVNVAAVAQQFTPGTIISTENPMDLAINGAGFFQVGDGESPPMYTRNGQFKVNREGYIETNNGLKLLGYQADPSGVILPSHAVPLQLPTAGVGPNMTSKVDLEVNLDARKDVVDPLIPFDINDPLSYTNATSITVFDEKGQPVALSVYFRKNVSGVSNPQTNSEWEVFASADGVPINGGAAIHTLEFDSSGSGPVNLPAPPSVIQFTVDDNPALGTLEIPDIELDMARFTEYGANFSVTDQLQDGFSPGQLVEVVVEKDGMVMARYTNGETKAAGQVELATFRNPQGLHPMGNNVWALTHAAGDPIRGAPGVGNLGVIQSSALEESNVDLTAELVNMITAQRHYQANAQTIKTQDQIMQTAVNLR